MSSDNDKFSKSAGDYFDELPPDLKNLVINSLQFNDINSTSKSLSKKIYQIKKKVIIERLKQQINFKMPNSLRNANDNSIKKDLLYYRRAYEEEAKNINEIIDCTNKLNEQLLAPLLSIHDSLKDYKNKITKNLEKINIPFKNKKQGLNENEISNMDIKNVEVIDNQLDSYKEEANNLLNNINIINKGFDEDFKLIQDSFSELVESVKILRKTMFEGIRIFENISPKFEDLNDQETIQKAIMTIINPLSKITELINKSKQKLKEVDKTPQTKDNQNENMIDKMKSICEQLNNKSKIIAEKINETRETINLQRIDLPSLELDEVNVQDINSSINSMKEKIDKTNQENEKIKEELNKKTEKFINQSRLDILFIIDSTNSINTFVNDIKQNFLKIIDEIIQKCPTSILHVGFIAYKDFCDLDFGEEYLDIDFIRITENPDGKNEISKKIHELKPEGGGDTCEDLAGAFELSLKKSWKGFSKFAILATDAPCHGIEFHDPEIEDNYPKGDREHRDIKEFVKELAEKEIYLFCAEYDESTQKMFGIFKEIYNKNKKKNSKCQIAIQSGEDLSNTIIAKAIKIYEENRL
jgi:myosin protein heavy chain